MTGCPGQAGPGYGPGAAEPRTGSETQVRGKPARATAPERQNREQVLKRREGPCQKAQSLPSQKMYVVSLQYGYCPILHRQWQHTPALQSLCPRCQCRLPDKCTMPVSTLRYKWHRHIS